MINNTFEPLTFATNLTNKCIDSKFGMSIGSMHGTVAKIDKLFNSVRAAHA